MPSSQDGTSKYWDETLKPVYAFVGFVYVLWVTMKDLWGQLVKWFTENVSTPFTKAWNDFWTGIQSWWTENVSTPFKAAWSEFWTGVFSWWNTNIKEPFKAGWEAFWSGLRKWWDENVAVPFSKAWNEFWTVALQKWDEFKKNVSTAWNQFWTDLTTAWTNFKRDVSEQWNAFWKSLRETWDGVKKWWDESILPLFDQLKAKWDAALKPFKEGWDDFVGKIDTVFSKITGFFSSLETTINRLISIGKKLVNLDFSGGGDGGDTDGSNAGGLYRVPFDGYRSELHKGERVLTNAEATVYNRIEKLGVLGVLEALSNGASQRIAQATAPQTVIQNQTVVHEGDRKEVNVNVARIDASNPDEGRAFVQRVSYLMP